MTLRLTIGIDPGTTGAIALLRDGALLDAIDTPRFKRAGKGEEVNAAEFARYIRSARSTWPGAHVHAIVELVGGMAPNGRKQGGSSMFNFGQADGKLIGSLETLGIPITRVTPQVWKRHMKLLGSEKEASRGVAIQHWPAMSEWFALKGKGTARADAALIARWGWETGRHAEAG